MNERYHTSAGAVAMTSPAITLLQAPRASRGGRRGAFDWRAVRERVLRVPLAGKLLGANLIIAIAAVAASAVWGHAALVALVCGALAVSFAVNAALVRVALAPLEELERVAEAVARGEEYVRVTDSPVADERVERVGTTVNRLLDSIAADRRGIHQLIQRSLAGREAERAKLSRELRESTAQQLCALDLQLAIATGAFASPRGWLALGAAREIAAQQIESVRTMADSVYPGLLRELGLNAALAALAVRVRNRSPLQVSVDTSGAAPHLSPALITAMYHVAEEAVRNAERHAHARNIRIRLSGTTDELRLEVSDDGHGFDVEATERARPCVGLFQARELIANVHGVLKIESAPSHGTRVIATARLDQGDTC
jgi:signal transduction histidine kinase